MLGEKAECAARHGNGLRGYRGIVANGGVIWKVTDGLFVSISGDEASCVETLGVRGYGIVEWLFE